MIQFVTFALSSFPLTFTLLGIIVAGFHILRASPPRTMTTLAKEVLRWFFFFGVGVTFFYNFICHVFFGEMAAQFIGWGQSPFQAEVGWASLGYSVLGFMAFRGSRDLCVGTIAALSCFMLGAAIGHIYQMVVSHNFAPGNAGVMFWCDILIPVFGWLLIWKSGSSPKRLGKNEEFRSRKPHGY